MDLNQPQLNFTRVISSRYQIESCAFSTDGRMFAACLSDGSVRLYTVQKQVTAARNVGGADTARTLLKLDRIFRQHRSNVWCVAFSKNNKLLCSCSSDKTVMLYSIPSLSLQTMFVCYHKDTVWCCSFSELADSTTVIASGSSDCTVAIYNATTGQIIHRLTGFQGAVDTLAFSPNGEKLCTGSRDCTVRIWWNLTPWKQPTSLVLSTNEQPVRVCRFSPINVNILVTSAAGKDHSLSLWDLNKEAFRFNTDLANPQPKLRLSGHCNIVWNCCFFNDNKQSSFLITCSGDKTARLAIILI